MRKISICTTISILLIFLFAMISITYASENPEEIKLQENKTKTNKPTEEEKKAYKIFEEILDLTENSDTQTVLPQIEELYLKIIKEYPDLALAQESYWRLISLYVEKTVPPDYEKAENSYKEFLEKYPESPIKYLIIDTLSKSYYKTGKWDKLTNLISPVIKEYEGKGKLQNPEPLFMYAEAKDNLGDLTEAEKSYKLLIELFPKSNRVATSKARLEEIEKRKGKADTGH
jgi:tetratricopeptide (TPR) repeat protein